MYSCVLGLECDVIYPQGLSCTLPEDLQLQMLRFIPGLHNVIMTRPGKHTSDGYEFIVHQNICSSVKYLKENIVQF